MDTPDLGQLRHPLALARRFYQSDRLSANDDDAAAAADDDDDDDDDALGRARVVERDELSIPDVASARNEQNPAPSGPFADTHIIVLVLETPSTTRARRATALESS